MRITSLLPNSIFLGDDINFVELHIQNSDFQNGHLCSAYGDLKSC